MVLEALARIHRTYVLDLRANADAEAEVARRAGGADRQMVVVVLTVLVCLIFIEHYGNSGRISYWQDILRAVGRDDWASTLRATLYSGPDARFNRKVFWAATRVIAYVLIPLAVVKLTLPGVSAREVFGLSTRQPLKHIPLYLVMLAVIAPFVVGASFFESFQRKYPFYKLDEGESLWPWFIAWELLYAMQFVALEMFYRGFIVHGLKPRLGYASIFVMMIPYMMIHFGKPLPECVGSIIAGFALGSMSLATGAIWGGALLHVIVAWAMDALSLAHQSG